MGVSSGIEGRLDHSDGCGRRPPAPGSVIGAPSTLTDVKIFLNICQTTYMRLGEILGSRAALIRSASMLASRIMR